MSTMIDDMIDLIRLRVKPLANYQYPIWQSALVVIFLGVIGGVGAQGLGDNVLGRIAFFILFTWLQLNVVAYFMALWSRLFKQKVEYSLFGVLMACNGMAILSPLASWLPDDVGIGVNIALAIMGLAITINSLAIVTQLSYLKVFVGALLAGPLVLILLMTLSLLGIALGWISLPAELSRVPVSKTISATKNN